MRWWESVPAARESKSPAGANGVLVWAAKDFDHFLATNLCVALSFLLYHTFAELDRRLGPGSIRRLLFSPQAAEESGALLGGHATR